MFSLTLELDAVGAAQKKRADSDNVILRQAKIRMLAYKGKFDPYCSEQEIAMAKKGSCPQLFCVHHLVPLACKNSDVSIKNLIVLDKITHAYLHNRLYSPALRKCQPGQSCVVQLPDMDPNEILVWDDVMPFAMAFEADKRRLEQIIRNNGRQRE